MPTSVQCAQKKGVWILYDLTTIQAMNAAAVKPKRVTFQLIDAMLSEWASWDDDVELFYEKWEKKLNNPE